MEWSIVDCRKSLAISTVGRDTITLLTVMVKRFAPVLYRSIFNTLVAAAMLRNESDENNRRLGWEWNSQIRI